MPPAVTSTWFIALLISLFDKVRAREGSESTWDEGGSQEKDTDVVKATTVKRRKGNKRR
jgi:hypothetical protein